MSIRFNPKHLALCLSLSVFFSCKKDDTTAPTPPPAGPTLFEQVQGRWNAEIDMPSRTSNISAKEQGRPEIAAVEFFSDSTYIVAFGGMYDNAVKGKFKPVDSATINLSGEGTVAISNIKIAEDSISFSFVFGEDDTAVVKAAKAEDIAISADKKPLLKSWIVDKSLQDGASLYQQYSIAEDGKIRFFFSAAGTFYAQYDVAQHQVTQFANWKWHPEVANAALIYSLYGETMYNSYYKIISISNTSLTVEEVAPQSSGSGTDSRTFVLTAE